MSIDPSIANVVEHCDMMSNLYPDLRDEYYDVISNYCQQKLWHQLTQCILRMVLEQSKTLRTGTNNNGENSFVLLYNNIVLPFYHKLHPLSTSRIAFAVANTVVASLDSTSDESVIAQGKTMLQTLLTNYQDKLKEFINDAQHEASFPSYRSATSSTNRHKDTKQNLMEAIIYLQSKYYLTTIYIKSKYATSNNMDISELKQDDDMKELIQTMKKNAKILKEWSTSSTATTTSSSSSNTSIVQAAHYECFMTYYKMVGPPELFYEQAMQFLTYSPPPSSSTTTATNENAMAIASSSNEGGIVVNYYQLAIDLCLSALTGDGVYNLVELEQAPCVSLLKTNTSEYLWLVELLEAVSYGKVLDFRSLIQKYAVQIQSQPILALRATAIEEKLILMALMEYIVSVSNQKTRSSSTGDGSHSIQDTATIITLSDIALALHMADVEQVEYIIMRACSVSLLKAYIDQVDGIVYIQSVKPRVLNTEQMMSLAQQFHHWSQNVSTIENYMKDNTTTLFA